jgi:carbonic anhydrase/acetyltransferase-like protein (isoleucine patch superfamily)
MSELFPHLSRVPQVHPSVLIQPGAVVLGDVEIGEDSSVWYHTVIRGDVYYIRIGARTNIQDLCMVHVSSGRNPAIIGNDVTIGHRAVLHGCTVGDRVLVGMGAIVLDRAVVGDDCIIGAGALVTEGTVIPPGSLVLGAPARVKRLVTDAEREDILRMARTYAELARAYPLRTSVHMCRA